ncbi:hypothetical protein HNQ51_001463 [Inhella inkyongensis]|uniref:Histidine kinase domain-containing protein n=1 Tax=Inhella inkyongensis TaxID=392593 RepID=A0A840S6S9_9BURK|nr:histidine kinase [Inhella inkyongensis]MBB5204170.1 hypothetical protein [Inhella inkyongensis]
MSSLLPTLRLAQQDFFKLRKHRPAPAWALWLLTLIYSLGFGLGFMVIAGVLGRQWNSLSFWQQSALPFIAVALVIGLVVHSVFSLIEHFAPQRFIDWSNGEPTLAVGAFFGLSITACVGLGVMLSRLLLGGLPGMQHVSWQPSQSWSGFLVLAAFISVIASLWAWQEWREEQLKRQAQEAQLRLLQAQIEPHFLFNTLANVRSLIDCEPRAAGELLDAFTDHLRASLLSMRSERVSLDKELELVGHYLRLMQLRMCERLQFHIEADDAARQALLPPLLLQPLVENAIQHGLECQVEGGTVRIKATVETGTLRIQIQDDGRGLEAPRRSDRKGHGVALNNIRERLKSRYGEAGTLQLHAALPRGTEALIALPYQTQSSN